MALKKNLIPDEFVTSMIEKDSFMEQYVLSTDNQVERIQRFIECLQNSSLDDYKHFIYLLYKTKQELLITKLVTSCKGTLDSMFLITDSFKNNPKGRKGQL